MTSTKFGDSFLLNSEHDTCIIFSYQNDEVNTDV